METNDDRPAEMALTLGELHMINNAMNEVCNGVHIADFEFHARLGVACEQAQSLLARVHQRLAELAA